MASLVGGWPTEGPLHMSNGFLIDMPTGRWKLSADTHSSVPPSVYVLVCVTYVFAAVCLTSNFFVFFSEISSGSEEAEADEDGVFKRKGQTTIWVSVVFLRMKAATAFSTS